jgi:ABC-type glycerol-3-phosphate transport system permease component
MYKDRKKSNVGIAALITPRERRQNVFDKTFRITLYVFTLLYCMTLLIPIVWMLLNSFKDPFEYYLKLTFTFPETLKFGNYSYFLTNLQEVRYTSTGRITYNLFDMFLYSLIWAAGPSFVGVTLNLLCAYVLARYKFVGRNFLYNLGVVIMVVPVMSTGGASILVARSLGTYDNMTGLILTSGATAFSGLNFLILYAACKAIPVEYTEAIAIDGGGHMRILITLVPMVLPIWGVLWIMGFIGGWNDYNTFMIMLPSYANIALGMYNFQYNAPMVDGVNMPQVLAGFVLVCIPSVFMYLINQKAITSKFYVGGIKG